MTAAVPARVGLAFPGSQSPSVGFDQPFEMLDGCHERVSRTLWLLSKLPAHVRTGGADAQVQSAATDVLRYFDIAAPLHHDDEELHVFSLLFQQNDAVATVLIEKMLADHEQKRTHWAALRPALIELSAADPTTGDARVATEAFERQIAAVAALYAAHVKTESQILFPAAARLKTDVALQQMSDDMRCRRTTP